ncbi:hypothetical protein VTL71DRAFT_5656 [Oculimacula yallundae]|uniref:Uncharacterized protein n=1 Tax=Oculimacula yallundae TaxID=86028 RepID=A0ABR4BZT5_9HELO
MWADAIGTQDVYTVFGTLAPNPAITHFSPTLCPLPCRLEAADELLLWLLPDALLVVVSLLEVDSEGENVDVLLVEKEGSEVLVVGKVYSEDDEEPAPISKSQGQGLQDL